jgi:hypothetical protein
LFGQEHVDRYRETDGEEGHNWQSTTVLLLRSAGGIALRLALRARLLEKPPQPATGLVLSQRGGALFGS